MKSYKGRLVATSALTSAAMLVSGAALAESMKPSLSVGGYYFMDLYAHDRDGADLESNTFMQHDAEVHFKMSGELDNGLKVGGRIELEAQPENARRQIDDHWISLSSGWGRVDFGATNGSAWKQSWSVNPPSVGHGINSGVQTEWFSSLGCAFRCPLGSTHLDTGNDDTGIHYFSPKFNGFQLALSYRPESVPSHSFNQGPINPTARQVAIDKDPLQEDGHKHDDRTTVNLVDVVDGSVTYSGDMDGVGFNLYLGAVQGANTDEASVGDYEMTQGGVTLSTSGFTVGAMIADADAPGDGKDGTSFSAGISYGDGPWKVSFTGLSGEAGDREHDIWQLGATYVVGPGLRLLASYQDAELSGPVEDSGSAIIGGIAVNF